MTHYTSRCFWVWWNQAATGSCSFAFWANSSTAGNTVHMSPHKANSRRMHASVGRAHPSANTLMHRRVKRTRAHCAMTAPCAEGGFTLAHKHNVLLFASQRGDSRSGSPATRGRQKLLHRTASREEEREGEEQMEEERRSIRMREMRLKEVKRAKWAWTRRFCRDGGMEKDRRRVKRSMRGSSDAGQQCIQSMTQSVANQSWECNRKKSSSILYTLNHKDSKILQAA